MSTTTPPQRITPPEMPGRVSAVFLVASSSRSLGLVAVAGGLLGAGGGLEVAAAGFAVRALLVLASPAVRLVNLPEPEPVSCHPLSDEGTFYEPGEFCRDSDHGAVGLTGDGETIVCEDDDCWRWERA